MSEHPILNNACIVQQGFDLNNHIFGDMARLSYQRHAAYASAHKFDYWNIMGCTFPHMRGGGWDKVYWIGLALKRYDYVVWIDTDAAITSECDLREALPQDKQIGAVLHNAPWFPQYQVPAHYNVGVTFWRSSPETLHFCEDWFSRHPGDVRWVEQGVFNQMVKEEAYVPLFYQCDDTWNATVNVHQVNNPHITGWHGVPLSQRLALMRKTLAGDYLKFRV